MSLLTRLFLLVLLAVLPALGVAAYHEFELRQIREYQVHDEALRLVRLANSEMDRITEGSRQLLSAFAENPVIAAGDWAACNTAAARLFARLDGYFNIGIVTVGGEVVCSALPGGRGVNIGGSPAFQRAIAADEFAIGIYETSKVDATPILPFSVPLRDGEGRKIGLAFGTLRLDWLARHFAGRFAGSDVTLLLVDRGGAILLRLPDPGRWVGKTLDPKYSALLNATADGTAEVMGIDGVRRIVGYSPLGIDPQGIYVGVGLTKAAVFGGIEAATVRGGVLVAVCLCLALAAAWAGGTLFLRRPIGALLAASDRWRRGDYAARTGLTDQRSEIARLGRTFDDMAVELEKRESEIRQANETLEQRVVERTAELVLANRRLAIETEERRRAEEALHHAQKLELIGQLTSGVAHDFNNLLTAVLGNIEIAQGRVKDEAVLKMLASASRAAERGAQLTEQLLAFSRKQHLRPRAVDVNALVVATAEMLNRSIGAAVRTEQRLALDLWPAVADPSQVELVLLNLAINARDAMPLGGSLLIETRNSGPADQDRPADLNDGDGDYVCIAVSDTGTGMSQEVLSKALEPFFTTKEPGRGSGLGLSMVYGVAKQSGGGLALASRAGEGTSVSVYLPRAAAVAETAERAGPAPAEHGAAALAGKSVLVIDDDPDVREVTTMMLSELGCVPVPADGGAAALAMLDRGGIVDLAVIDFAMPGMNGMETAERIIERRPEVPILIITGYADTAVRGERLAAVRLLKKPFSRDELAGVLLAAQPAGAANVVPIRAPAGR